MGLLQSIFGSTGTKLTPSHNKDESKARKDYVKDAVKSGGKDPIPKTAPDSMKGVVPDAGLKK